MTFRQVFQATLAVLVTLLGAYLLFRLRELIISLLIAFIFASAISPLVARLNRRFSLGSSIGFVYLGLFVIATALLTIIISPLATQAVELVRQAPELAGQAQTNITALQERFDLPAELPTPNLQEYYGQLARQGPRLAAGVLNVTLGFVSSVAGVLIILVMAFYWLLERRDIEGTWLGLVPRSGRATAREVIQEVEGKLGAYVRGQLLLAVIVGAISFVGLWLLGVQFKLVLALIAGIGELIPLAGPIIGAIPAIIIALATGSWQKAALVAVLYLGIQQVENNFLVPKVMQRSVGLSALTVLVAVLAGAALLGIVGALLAVPVASATQVILKHTLFRKEPYVMQAGRS